MRCDAESLRGSRHVCACVLTLGVLQFAGDAMLAIWQFVPDSSDEKQQLSEEKRDPSIPADIPMPSEKDLNTLIMRATQCAIEIQNEMHAAKLSSDVTLSVKFGIGVGPTHMLHVGGVRGRFEYLACGPSCLQAFEVRPAMPSPVR